MNNVTLPTRPGAVLVSPDGKRAYILMPTGLWVGTYRGASTLPKHLQEVVNEEGYTVAFEGVSG